MYNKKKRRPLTFQIIVEIDDNGLQVPVMVSEEVEEAQEHGLRLRERPERFRREKQRRYQQLSHYLRHVCGVQQLSAQPALRQATRDTE